MAFMVLASVGFSPEAMFSKAVEVHDKHAAIMEPGQLVFNPIDAVSLGLALMFGTAGLPHILMRFFRVQRQRSPQIGVLRHWLHRLLLHP